MKQVKKYTSFEDLKSFESKATDIALSLKKHADFEKVIKHIKPENVSRNNSYDSKEHLNGR